MKFNPARTLGFLGLCLLAVLWATSTPAAAAAEKRAFAVRRGTNISHWLSQSNRRGAERQRWFTREDVGFLAKAGFDHLRIPIDEEQMWDESGRAEQEAFELLDHALDWCAENQLRVIVDLHILRSHHFNSKERPLWTKPEAQERFFQCWRDLSDRLHQRPNDLVAYELMNEPVADDPEDWNKLVGKAVAVIRAKEPHRTIVIGSNRWQSVDTFDRLKVPENDQNILLSFHFYEPFLLTHHQASWTSIGKYAGPVHYPGATVTQADLAEASPEIRREISSGSKEWNRAIIESKLAKPLALAKRTGLPLYCGEWGCLDTVPREDRLHWYADMVSVLSENGIGWATWDYKGGFGLRKGSGEADRAMIAILLGKSQ